MKTTENLFDIPLTFYVVPNSIHKRVKEIAESVIEDVGCCPDGTDGHMKNALSKETWHYYLGEKNIFNARNDMDFFKEWVMEKYVDYMTTVLGYEANADDWIQDAWINKSDHGGYQHQHSHANSFVSACYYINYDSAWHSPIQFKNPVVGSEMRPVFVPRTIRETRYNAGWVRVPIQERRVYFWTSNLLHKYEENSGNNRVSLAMNFMPRRFQTDNGLYSFTTNA